MQCILAATLDISLNFPDYTLQLIDNFVPLRELLPSYQLHYGLETFAYILYTCQYPLVVLYVRLILRDFGGSLPHSQSCDTPQFSRANGSPRSRSPKRYQSLALQLEKPSFVTGATSLPASPMKITVTVC